MKKENGITLIALIITIIVMLILVGVTINVALNGGLFDKAKTATIQTEIAQIQEQLVLAKATAIANNNGYIPSDYGITLSNLDLSDNIKEKYDDKLTISQDGTLYYTDSATESDIVYFENAGITKLQELTGSNIEYYVMTFTDGSDSAEYVYAINYINSNIKMYYGENSGNPSIMQTIPITKFDTSNFTITLDGKETLITNATAIFIEVENHSLIAAYIKDKKLYFGENENFNTENGYATLDPNFNANRLQE